MGKPAAPPSPNYSGAAALQGQNNIDVARMSGRMSNPNVYGPRGSQEVSWNGDQPSIFQSYGAIGDESVRQQQLAELGLSQTANAQLGRISDTLATPFSFTGDPQRYMQSTSGIYMQPPDPGVLTGGQGYGSISQGPNLLGMGMPQGIGGYRPGGASFGNNSLPQFNMAYGNGAQYGAQLSPGGSMPQGTQTSASGNSALTMEMTPATAGGAPAAGAELEASPSAANPWDQYSQLLAKQSAGQQNQGYMDAVASGQPFSSSLNPLSIEEGRNFASSVQGMMNTPGYLIDPASNTFLSADDFKAKYGGLPAGYDPTISMNEWGVANQSGAAGLQETGYNSPAASRYAQYSPYAPGSIPQTTRTMPPESAYYNNPGQLPLGSAGGQGGLATNTPGQMTPYGDAGGGSQGGAFGWSLGGAPNLQKSLNESGVPGMPVGPGMTAQQAIMSRLAPNIAQTRKSTETDLINQGLRPGGEAYDNAIKLLGQQENDQMTQAALQGLGLDFQANQQGFGQAQARGDFGNQAQLQQYGAGLTGQGQAFGQEAQRVASQNAALQQAQDAALKQQMATNQAQGQGFEQTQAMEGARNAAMLQNYQNQLQQMQAGNSSQQQRFNQELQAGQFGNTALQQQLAQQLAIRSLPINEITALLSGGQVQNPAFPQWQGSTVTPAPIFAGSQAQGQYDMQRYQQQMASANALMGGLFSLGGSAMGLIPH